MEGKPANVSSKRACYREGAENDDVEAFTACHSGGGELYAFLKRQQHYGRPHSRESGQSELAGLPWCSATRGSDSEPEHLASL